MSIAGIEKVREAETKAAQIKKTSEEAAAQIIADGKKDSKVLLEDAEKKRHRNLQGCNCIRRS